MRTKQCDFCKNLGDVISKRRKLDGKLKNENSSFESPGYRRNNCPNCNKLKASVALADILDSNFYTELTTSLFLQNKKDP